MYGGAYNTGERSIKFRITGIFAYDPIVKNHRGVQKYTK
jgi:hypothetical protein